MLFCKFCKICNNSLFYRIPPVAASEECFFSLTKNIRKLSSVTSLVLQNVEVQAPLHYTNSHLDAQGRIFTINGFHCTRFPRKFTKFFTAPILSNTCNWMLQYFSELIGPEYQHRTQDTDQQKIELCSAKAARCEVNTLTFFF